jgi:hypothetical protein
MKHRTLSILTLSAFALAAALAAQTPAEPQATTTAAAAQTGSGRVISSTPTAIVIEDTAGTRRTYIVDAESSVPSGLAAGTMVEIEFHPLDGGRFHAARVTTTAAPEPVTQPAPTQAVPRTTAPPPADSMPAPAPAPMDTTTSGGTSRPMPATASPLPLVGLIGLGSLAGGLAARVLRRR